MISFLNDKQLKRDLLKEVRRHEKMDMIIQGTYGKMNGHWKGCKVGCSIHSLNAIRGTNHPTNNHSVYEREFGVPRIIARLTDRIFEGLPVKESHAFPYKFWAAVPVGVDLDPVWRKFLIWLLVNPEEGVIRHAKREQTKTAIQDVANLLERSLTEKITFEDHARSIQHLHQLRMQHAHCEIKLMNLRLICKLILIISIALCLCSCGSTWVVQGVTVHSPTRVYQDRDAYLVGAAALAGFVVVDQLTTPEHKEKIRKAIGAN